MATITTVADIYKLYPATTKIIQDLYGELFDNEEESGSYHETLTISLKDSTEESESLKKDTESLGKLERYFHIDITINGELSIKRNYKKM